MTHELLDFWPASTVWAVPVLAATTMPGMRTRRAVPPGSLTAMDMPRRICSRSSGLMPAWMRSTTSFGLSSTRMRPSSETALRTRRGCQYLPPLATQAVMEHNWSGVARVSPWPMDRKAVSAGVMAAPGLAARQARLPGRMPVFSAGNSMPVRLPMPTIWQPSTMARQPMVLASLLK